jgi:DNA-binding Lrp family transcriptional regulator
MSLIWDHAPVMDSTELLLLLAMADFAHNDGGSIFPAQATLAQRIRLSQRQTRRILRTLADKGLIEKTGEMPDHRFIYRIKLEAMVPPDIAMSARTPMTGDPGHSYVTPPPDIAMSAKPLDVTVTEPLDIVRSVTGPKYSALFENFWKDYPTTTNASKSKTWAIWGKLSNEDRAAAHLSLPAFQDSDRWREGYIPHPTTFLNGRLWENLPSPNGHEKRISKQDEDDIARIVAETKALEGRRR